MADTKWSQFPSATPVNADEVVGLHSGNNARFSIANIVAAVRNGLASIFVPKTDVGAAGGVASLDSTGKVPSAQLPPIASTAADVTYDNTQSGLTAENVQDAIDELAAGAGGGGVDPETIALVEESSTATTAHPLGTVFYFNDLLYRALADISIGDTINTAAGGNATQTSIAQNFKRVVTLTAAEYALLSSAEKAADIVYIVTDETIDYALVSASVRGGGGTQTAPYPSGYTNTNCTVISCYVDVYNNRYITSDICYAVLTQSNIQLNFPGASSSATGTVYALLFKLSGVI